MTPLAIRARGDDGAVSILVVGLTTALLMVAGLVYDGGQILNGRREAFAVAHNAARAGAQAVDLDALRAGGTPQLDPVTAHTAAADYLTRHGYTGDVQIAGNSVQVQVRLDVPMVLLGAVGVPDRAVTGTGSARIVRGVSQPEGGSR